MDPFLKDLEDLSDQSGGQSQDEFVELSDTEPVTTYSKLYQD
jgi:hypothetical protein